jgi:hypothetical protein
MSLLEKIIGRSARPPPKLDLEHPLVMELSAALRVLDAMPLSHMKKEPNQPPEPTAPSGRGSS